MGSIPSPHNYCASQAFSEPSGVEAHCREAGTPREEGKQEESYVVNIQRPHWHHTPEEQPRAVLDLFLEGSLEVLAFSCATSRGSPDAAITTAAPRNGWRDRCTRYHHALDRKGCEHIAQEWIVIAPLPMPRQIRPTYRTHTTCPPWLTWARSLPQYSGQGGSLNF
jgi:hypothetical protein